jgi:DNA processing protein
VTFAVVTASHVMMLRPHSSFGEVRMTTWLDRGIYTEPDRRALLQLAHIIEPGDRRLGALVWRDGPQAALDQIERSARFGGIAARLAALGGQVPADLADEVGARIVTPLDDEWPTQLNQLCDSRPLALWVHGAAHLRTMLVRSIAFVGARAATNYGERVCAQWVGHCCDNGVTVVSGGAYGIDGAAHRGALAAGGMTVAVLATGVDVPYPLGHAALFAQIADAGLLISEHPPGATARRQRFLARNRIIAAATRGTVVVEAALRSGTTSTANAAAALHRPVLAIPGPVTSAMSAGCHQLIADGQAAIATHVSDLLMALDGIQAGAGEQTDVRSYDALEHRERVVLDAMPTRGSICLDDLVCASGLDERSVLAGIGVLVGQGLVEPDQGEFRRQPGVPALIPGSASAR